MMGSGLLKTSCHLAQSPQASSLEWRLRWDWNWPLWATVLAIVAAALWVTSIYFREKSLAGKGMRTLLSLLRLTVIGLVLLMFAQPAIEWFHRTRPRLVLLVDQSASMETLDRYPEATADISRLQACQKFLLDGNPPLIEEWQTDFDLAVVTFAEQIEQVNEVDKSFKKQLEENLQAKTLTSNAETRLGDAIDFSLRELSGKPAVAIVLLTDGIATEGQTLQQAAERARRLRIPIYPVAIGSDRRQPDVAVQNLLVEEIVFPGDRLEVEATVHATGFEGKEVEVTLRNAASSKTPTRILAQTTIKLPANEATKTVRLAIQPTEPGELTLELAIAPLSEEANPENNIARQVIEVRNQKIRVLFAQSQPSYEYRALKSLLERDPAVELRVLLQEADADYSTVDDTALQAFPTSEKELLQYDVLLLGDLDPGLLPRSVWPLVERFVTEHGGGMVGISGPNFMPFAFRGNRSLEALLPMELKLLNPLRSQIVGKEAFAVRPTVLGWRTPSLQLGETQAASRDIWQALPPVLWILRLENLKPSAQVLAEATREVSRLGPRLPVILRHYVGAGEVLFHATDETWRWRWQTDDRYFARYWGQVVRRLGRGRLAAGRQGVQLIADRSLYKPGEPVQLQAKFRNPAQAPADGDSALVQLQGALGPTRQVTLQRHMGHRGLFNATVNNLLPGRYKMQLLHPDLGSPADTTHFEIQEPPREFAQVAVNDEGLKRAAVISGGKFYTLASASQLSQALGTLPQHRLAESPPRPLWNTHAAMALLLMLLTCEWLLRRRHGML